MLSCAICARAETLLLNNNGALTLAIGPAPNVDSVLVDSSGGYNGGSCIFTDAIPGVSYGDCAFDSSAYNKNEGSISFYYQPAQTTGNVIFCTGGDPSNGTNSNFFGLYQNWYWGNNYPVVAASAGGNNTWGYYVQANALNNWTWDTTHWYQITINYQMTGSPSDHIDFYIDGVQQTNYGLQGHYSPITPMLSGAAAGPLWLGCYGW